MKDKLNIEVKTDKDHKDSFWFYDGTVIATKGKYVLITAGEVQAYLKPNGERLSQYRAIEYADENKWTDKDLDKLELNMNNWFEIEIDMGDYFEDTEYISYNYDDAIEDLKNI